KRVRKPCSEKACHRIAALPAPVDGGQAGRLVDDHHRVILQENADLVRLARPGALFGELEEIDPIAGCESLALAGAPPVDAYRSTRDALAARSPREAGHLAEEHVEPRAGARRNDECRLATCQPRFRIPDGRC